MGALINVGTGSSTIQYYHAYVTRIYDDALREGFDADSKTHRRCLLRAVTANTQLRLAAHAFRRHVAASGIVYIS